MSQVFYRKYRPKNFSEVEGQEHVVKTLQGSVLLRSISHAYLFSGPRGTGKTTIARLLAKVLNCGSRDKNNPEPCDKCMSCLAINKGSALDLIEIDAASNRGIDEIRNLKEAVNFLPHYSKYKFYIIDEAHMLTKEASNALLKMLEEPPAHAIFILATTEKEKILPTIISRAQSFDFQKISTRDIIKKLERISKEEKIKVEPKSLSLIALNAGGAMRDAESHLSKVASFTNRSISHDAVQKILGIIPLEKHFKFWECIAGNDRAGAIQLIDEIYYDGVDLERFTESFIDYLRRLLILNLYPAKLASFKDDLGDYSAQLMAGQAQKANSELLVLAVKKFIEINELMKTTPILQLPLELAVIDLTK